MLRFVPRTFTVSTIATRQCCLRRSRYCSTNLHNRTYSYTWKQCCCRPQDCFHCHQIEGLTLLQTSELVSQLKSRLNIQDIAMPVGVPMAAAPNGAAAAEEEKPAEKTEFNLKIEKVDATTKAKVIREVKNLAGLNLVEAKKFVESVPKVLKESINKEEAEKLKKALEAVGATVILE
ncbi:unnamed protein product [Absidia cylindrospora]